MKSSEADLNKPPHAADLEEPVVDPLVLHLTYLELGEIHNTSLIIITFG